MWQKSGIIRLYDRFLSWQLKQWADSIYLTPRYSQCAFMRYKYSDTYTMIQIQYYVVSSVFRVVNDTRTFSIFIANFGTQTSKYDKMGVCRNCLKGGGVFPSSFNVGQRTKPKMLTKMSLKTVFN